MKKTEEQVTIVEAGKELKAGEVLKIDAGAGCAKSSTLVFIAEEVVESSLCLVFNKAAQIEAEQKFPPHVLCKTTHSLAYSAIGHKYSTKLNRPQGGYVNVLGTGSEIAKAFNIQSFEVNNGKDLPASFLGLIVRNTVNRFEQSDGLKIDESHLPEAINEITEMQCRGIGKLRKSLVGLAERLWAMRIDLTQNTLATHDTYLKLYHLSNPKLPYKVIYLDEAQDSNPCVVDIILKQNAKKIVVGDRYQAIYGWRGAVNALDNIEGKELKLSTSFRYGQDVSDLASKVLEDSIELVSHTGLHTEVGEDVVDKTKPYTVLYRTNTKLVLDAVAAIQNGQSVNIEIDVRDFCNLLTSAVALYRNDMSKVKHEELLCYNNFGEFKEEAGGGGILDRLVKIIENGQSQKVLNALNNHKNTKYAKITFTTAHKSKGREWDQVELADDFPLHTRNGEWVGLSQEDQNLLYVASTRAIKKMNMNKSLKEIWVKDLAHKQDLPVEFVEDALKATEEVKAGKAKPRKPRKKAEVEKVHTSSALSEGALAASDRAELESMQAYAHYAMDLTDEEGYDLGLLDEMGYANYNLSDLSPT